VSALSLQHVLGLGSYETAWALLHKLRRAMVRPGRDRLAGEVEADEIYVGGVATGKRGRGAAKKAIVEVAVENSVPPRIMFGGGVAALPGEEQTFLIARGMHALRSGGPILRKLDVVEIAALFRTLAAMLLGETPPRGRLGAALAALPFHGDLLDLAERKRIASELRLLAEAGVDVVGIDLSRELLAAARDVVAIPMYGINHSFPVTVAVGMVLCEWARRRDPRGSSAR
jgi:hypothetical protein